MQILSHITNDITAYIGSAWAFSIILAVSITYILTKGAANKEYIKIFGKKRTKGGNPIIRFIASWRF